ncbi:hypothetical protein PAHAL_9G340900 [Panicum hallii]|uniref:Uncharacterized protein n=1 Tax=Panicum hallii TaxID=206008 RepID=A0A2T8I3G7_9POAL|nr:hypothetical protein PAHAL_9G340900 [Panicum hallii]
MILQFFVVLNWSCRNWTIILWICVPTLRGSFSFRAQNSFLLHLLLPSRAWNATKLYEKNRKSHISSPLRLKTLSLSLLTKGGIKVSPPNDIWLTKLIFLPTVLLTLQLSLPPLYNPLLIFFISKFPLVVHHKMKLCPGKE